MLRYPQTILFLLSIKSHSSTQQPASVCGVSDIMDSNI